MSNEKNWYYHKIAVSSFPKSYVIWKGGEYIGAVNCSVNTLDEIIPVLNTADSATARVAELEAQLRTLHNRLIRETMYAFTELHDQTIALLTPPQNTKGDDKEKATR